MEKAIISQFRLVSNFLKKRGLSGLNSKEREIISMRFGLKNGVFHTLEEICKELGLTIEQIRKIEAKAIRKILKKIHKERGGLPNSLKVYREYRKNYRKYLRVREFPNFKELERFIWKLFGKGYKITENVSYKIHVYAPEKPELPTEWYVEELWICNKKEKKCYLFEPKTDRENKLYYILGYLYHNYPKEFGLSKYQKRIKSLSRKEIEKFVAEAKKQTKLISLEEVKKLLKKKLQEP